MANVQVENGHIRIAHDLYRAAMKHLTPAQFKVWSAIIDYTYGWGKTADRIAYSQIADASGMCVSEVKRIAKQLTARNIITIARTDGRASNIAPVKDYETWLDLRTGSRIHPAGKLAGTQPETQTTPVADSVPPPAGKLAGTGSIFRLHQNHEEPCIEPCPPEANKPGGVASKTIRQKILERLPKCYRKTAITHTELQELDYWIEDHGEEAVLDAVNAAIAIQADKPRAYVNSWLTRNKEQEEPKPKYPNDPLREEGLALARKLYEEQNRPRRTATNA